MSKTKSIYQGWVESLQEHGQEIWLLQEHGDAKLFLIKNKISADAYLVYGELPSYHIWRGDHWFFTGRDIHEAYTIWEKYVLNENPQNSEVKL